jgi:hypothetical protein
VTDRTQKAAHRRGRTRWLTTTAVAALTLVVVGVIALEAAAPLPGPQPDPVPDLPPLAVHDDARPCTRDDEATVQEIRDEHRAADGRVASDQIYACPPAFDQLGVVYAGEVIGEVLRRRGGAWAQVNDDAYALEVGPLVGHRELDGFNTGMSVWLPDGLHEQIGDVGRPGQRGDVILIHGTIRQADPHDGGGITIRASELEVLAESLVVDDPLHVPQLVVAVILALLALAATVWARRSR